MDARHWLGGGAALLATCALATSVVSGLPDHGSPQKGKDPQGAARIKPAETVAASGCLQDVSELGGQGGGGASWQGSVSGHVLTVVHVASAAATDGAPAGGGKPSSVPDATASQAAPDSSRPQMFLIQGLSETELRRHRGRLVEVRGAIGQTRDVGRASSGSRDAGPADSTPMGASPVNPARPQWGPEAA
jgi:hypothetical protein